MNNKLPDFVLADLYRNNIVAAEEAEYTFAETKNAGLESVLPVVAAPGKKWFLGDNKKNILIIVADENAVIIDDENLAFLSKILMAFNCNLADVTIVNHLTDAKNFAVLKDIFHPHTVLFFGVHTHQVQLPFTIPYYQVQSYNDCRFLAAPGLATLNSSSNEARLEKSKLWISLKKAFEK